MKTLVLSLFFTTISFSSLCQTSMDSEKNRATISGFDIMFGSEFVEITTKEGPMKTKYQLNEGSDMVNFRVNDEEYKMKVLMIAGSESERKYLLRSKEGSLLLLEEK